MMTTADTYEQAIPHLVKLTNLREVEVRDWLTELSRRDVFVYGVELAWNARYQLLEGRCAL